MSAGASDVPALEGPWQNSIPTQLRRVLPGALPPVDSGAAGAVRQVAIGLLFAATIGGTIAALSGASLPLAAVGLGWVLAVATAIVPWHRLPLIAFGSVSAIVTVGVARLVATTGGIDSAYSGLYYLAAMLGIAVAGPVFWGIALGFVAALANLLPLAYSSVAAPDELVVRSALIVATTVFGAWLVATLSQLAAVAIAEHEQLGEEQATAAELRQSRDRRQEYMSVVAHELRNPLVAVGAAARVLSRDLAGKTNETLASGIVTEVRHALDLLDGLTDVSSLEAGRLRTVLGLVELDELVRRVTQGIAPDHEVVIHPFNRPITVLADDARVGQVLRNLVGNAAKYAPRGTTIEVTIGLSPDRDKAVVAVRDHGPGVPPMERSHLFERFSRLSTSGGTRGSGLGLYISRGILRDHGGDLVADWPAGGGTIFSFTLPLARVEDAVLGQPKRRPARGRRTGA